MNLIGLLSVSLSVFSACIGDLFSSVSHIKQLITFERDMIEELNAYIRVEEKRLKRLQELATEYQKLSSEASSDPETFAGNPINAYLLIKKLSVDWDSQIYSLLEDSHIKRSRQKIDEIKEKFPVLADLKGAATGIMRLQDTYKLETKHIANGNLAGFKSTNLTAADCYLIGKFAYDAANYNHCVSWMTTALNLHGYNDAKNGKRTDILDILVSCIYKQGKMRYALTLTNEILQLEPTHEVAAMNKEFFERELGRSAGGDDEDIADYDSSANTNDFHSTDDFKTYEALCRGEDVMIITNQHRLSCRYVTHGHPLLLLQPAKIEMVHYNPFVMLIHDSMSTGEVEVFKHLAEPMLSRATVQNVTNARREVSLYRVSKTTWLRPEHHPIVMKLRNRFQVISDMNFATAEDIQIANYGVGGQYEPHYDFAQKHQVTEIDTPELRNRIATWMTYLSDVPKGGATVFPKIGLKVFPKKGMAVFWYNLHRNGDVDFNTQHGACPVLIGSKWVANIWLHENTNEFKRPCSLNFWE